MSDEKPSDPIRWLAGVPPSRADSSESLHWLAGVPRRVPGEGPPFPWSILWLVLLLLAWLLRLLLMRFFRTLDERRG
jgi:hypothetical protein